MGNLGTAISTFAAPVIATQVGWSMTVKLYMVLLVLAAFDFTINLRGIELHIW